MEFGYDRADFEGLRAAIWTSGMPQEDGNEDEDKGKDGNKDTDAEASRVDSSPRGREEEEEEEEGKPEPDDEDVEKVERMMRKLQAVREAGEGMGYEQRRRMAARAVADVMKEL